MVYGSHGRLEYYLRDKTSITGERYNQGLGSLSQKRGRDDGTDLGHFPTIPHTVCYAFSLP